MWELGFLRSTINLNSLLEIRPEDYFPSIASLQDADAVTGRSQSNTGGACMAKSHSEEKHEFVL